MSRRKRETIEQAATAAKQNENKGPQWLPAFKQPSTKFATILVCLLLLTAVSGAVVSGWSIWNKSSNGASVTTAASAATSGSFSPTSSAVAAAQTSTTPQFTKEYIYAGSRLLSIEEGGGTSGTPLPTATPTPTPVPTPTPTPVPTPTPTPVPIPTPTPTPVPTPTPTPVPTPIPTPVPTPTPCQPRTCSRYYVWDPETCRCVLNH